MKKETQRKYVRAAVQAATVKKRIYNLARSRGEKPKKARKIAADLDEAVIGAHREIREIEKACLVGQLAGEVHKVKVRGRIREQTGLALSTIKNLVDGKTINPQQNTLTSLGVFFDMEIRAVPRTHGRRQSVKGIRH